MPSANPVLENTGSWNPFHVYDGNRPSAPIHTKTVQSAVWCLLTCYMMMFNGYYSISLRSLYLWCNMSTNFVFKTSYLAVLPWNLEIFCLNLDTTHSKISILLSDEKKKQDLEENFFGFLDISHRRYKLRRDVEQTPV